MYDIVHTEGTYSSIGDFHAGYAWHIYAVLMMGKETKNMNWKKKTICYMMMLSLLVFACACSKKVVEVDYTELPFAADKEQMIQAVGFEPDTEENGEDETVSYIYSKSKYLEYVGQMEYHSVADTILYSRWEYPAKSLKEGKKIYKDICTSFSKKYGKGDENKQTFSTNFSTDDKTLIVAYLEEEDKTTVSITNMPNNNAKSTDKETEKPAKKSRETI